MRRFILTLDIDWAPDWMIEEVAGALLAKTVKATWFTTHQSPAVRELQRHLVDALLAEGIRIMCT